MKATLERLAKESLEKDAQIKRQSEQIATLMKKLEKWLFESSSKGSVGEESDKESNCSEDSDDESIKKKESSLASMSVEHIQRLIANGVKAQLEGGSRKMHLYTKPYTKMIDVLRMPHGYQPPKFNQLMVRAIPNSTSPTLLRRAAMLAPRETDW